MATVPFWPRDLFGLPNGSRRREAKRRRKLWDRNRVVLELTRLEDRTTPSGTVLPPVNLATGLDASGNLIATGGQNDANWTVGGTAAQVVEPGNADWFSGRPAPDYIYPYAADGPNSAWIAINALSTYQGPGGYSFSRTFDLTGYNLSTVSISGSWGIDNDGTLYLNGNPIASFGPPSPPTNDHFHVLTDFSVPVGSPLLNQGLNTLSMTMGADTDGWYDAARLEGTVTGQASTVLPPLISKSFDPSTIPYNGTSSLGFALTNPAANTVAENGVGFTDILPAGLTAADESFPAGGGTVTVGNGNAITAPPNPGTGPLGVTFMANDGTTSNEIPVVSYSWGATRSTFGGGGSEVGPPILSLQSFQLVVSPGSAEPDLWGMLATGATFPQVTLYARTTGGSTPFQYLAYTLSDVQVTGFQTSGPGQDVLTLSFSKVEEKWTNQDQSSGNATSTVDVSYDTTYGTGGASGIDSAVPNIPGAGTEPLGLTIYGTNSTNTREIPVASYSWGATNPVAPGGGQGVPNLGSLQVVVNAGSAEPDLWGILAQGAVLGTVELDARNTGGGTAFQYLAYTLSNVQVAGFQTAGPGQDLLSLSFTKIEEKWTNQDQPGNPVDVSYDTAAPGQGGAFGISSAVPNTPAAGTEPLGLIINGARQQEIPVVSYSWGATNPVGADGSPGVPNLGSLQVVLDAGSAEPDLWGNLALGGVLGPVELDARTTGGPKAFQYLACTLAGVHVTGFQTDGPGQDALTLSFAKVEEKWTNQDQSSGNATSTVDVSYDTLTAEGGVTGIESTVPNTPAAGTEPLGLIINGATKQEIPVVSYSWGAANPVTYSSGAPSVGVASLGTLQVVVNAGSAEPDLWGILASGAKLDPVELDARTTGGPAPFQYLAYKLSNVFVTGFQTDGPGQDVLTLSFTKIEEKWTNQDQSSGNVTSTVDVSYDTLTAEGGVGSIESTVPNTAGAGTEPLGLIINGASQQEIPVVSYSWGATNPVGPTGSPGVPSLGSLQVVVKAGSAEPDLWGILVATAANGGLDMELDARTTGGPAPFQYLAYKLNNVFVTGFQTDGPGQDVLTLSFTKVEEKWTNQNEPAKPVAVSYDVAAGQGGASGIDSAVPNTPGAGTEPLGLIINGASKQEIPVLSYSWSAMAPAGTPILAPLQVVVNAHSAEPDLWGILAQGASLGTVTLDARTTGGDTPFQYLTYSLDNVYVTGFQTDGPGQDVLTLSFTKVEEKWTNQNDNSAEDVSYDSASGAVTGLRKMITLSGASIDVGGQLQFSVPVTAVGSGVFTNTTGSVSSTNGGTGLTATAQLTVQPPQADLQVTVAAGGPATIIADKDQIPYTITVYNAGPQTAHGLVIVDTLPANFSDVSYSFVSGAPSDPYTYIQYAQSAGVVTASVSSLAPGASVVVSITGTPTQQGTYSDTATASADETDPTPADNTDSASRSVTGPDLRGQLDLSLPASTVSQGDLIGSGIKLYITNLSDVASAGPFEITFYLSATGGLDANSVPLAGPSSQTVSGVPAGQTITVVGSPSWKIPNVAAGYYHLVAQLDKYNQIPVADTAYNIVALDGVFQVAAPELTIGSFTFGRNAVGPGEQVGGQVHLSVKNIGKGSLPVSFTVSAFLSTDGNHNASDIPLSVTNTTVVDPPLVAGATVDVNFAPGMSIPATVQPGQYYLGVLVDSDNNVTEGDYAPNQLWESVPVLVTNNTWTVLAYIDGDTNLWPEEQGFLNQLGQVNTTGNGPVNIVAIMDSPTGNTVEGKVTQGNTGNMAPIGDQDMGAAQTLANFISYGTALAPAQHYELIIEDHGNQWGVCQDDTSNDYLYAYKLQAALQNGPFMDFLEFDTCLTQDVEMATELIGEVGYVFGSQSTRLDTDQPVLHHQDYLNWLVSNPNTTPRNLAAYVATNDPLPEYSIAVEFQGKPALTSSSIDLGQLPALNTAIDNFAEYMVAQGTPTDWNVCDEARALGNTRSFVDPSVRDMHDFFGNVASLSTLDSGPGNPLATDAQNVVNQLAKVVIAQSITTNGGGLSIFLPPPGVAANPGYNGNFFNFANPTKPYGTHWLDFLLNPRFTPVPTVVTTCASGQGTSAASAVATGTQAGQRALIDGILETPADARFFSFSAVAGQVLYVRAEGEHIGTLLPVITVYMPDAQTVLAQEVVTNEDAVGTIAGLVLPQDGTYYIAISSFGNLDPLHPMGGTSGGQYYLDVMFGDPAQVAPRLTEDSTPVDFGNVVVGTTSFAMLRLTNTGGTTLTIQKVTAPDGSGFVAPGAPLMLPISLAPGEWIDVPIAATPSAIGPVTATLHILSDDPSNPDQQIQLSAVAMADTMTSVVAADVNPSVYGRPVTFTATVSAVPTSVGTPTGQVTFLDNGIPLGTGDLNSAGVATFTTMSLAAGTHSITASYPGAGYFNSSVSTAPLAEVVNPAPLTITADNKLMAYGGTMPPLTASYTGLVNGDTPATFTVSPNTPPILSTAPASSSPGTYAIVASGASDANYDISYVNGTLIINSTVLLLDPTGTGALSISGHGAVLANGVSSVIVDSTSPQAADVDGHGSITAQEFTFAGAQTSSNGLVGQVATNVPGVGDPLAATTPPSPSAQPHAAAIISGDTMVPLLPGTYDGGIEVSGHAVVTLAPGEYYLNGGLRVSGDATVIGQGVVLYIDNAAHRAGVSISGHAQVFLSAMTSGPYAGIALWQCGSSAVPVRVSDKASLNLAGTLDAAGAKVEISGNGSIFGQGVPGTPLFVARDLSVKDHGLLDLDNGGASDSFALPGGRDRDVFSQVGKVKEGVVFRRDGAWRQLDGLRRHPGGCPRQLQGLRPNEGEGRR